MAIKRTFRNAKFSFTNFSGTRFEDDKRTFTLRIDDEELAQELIDEGWDVKSREYDGRITWNLKVRVRFDVTPPKIKLIKNVDGERIMQTITENTVGRLDRLTPEKVDLTISQYHWKNMGKEGITAYLDIMYFTIEVPELEREYGDYAESEYPEEDDIGGDPF